MFFGIKDIFTGMSVSNKDRHAYLFDVLADDDEIRTPSLYTELDGYANKMMTTSIRSDGRK